MRSTLQGSAAAMALLAALAAAPAAAQETEAVRERDARLQAEREASFAAPRAEAMEVQMREAEERLAEAAARMAELSRRRLPEMARLGQRLTALDRPVLGVTIGGSERKGPVEGVEVVGVTPGSAAEEAGLRAGDVLVAINDESLGAPSAEEANRKLLDFMQGVVQGDELEVEYLRDGRRGTITVEPRQSSFFAFHWDPSWQVRVAPRPPGTPGAPWFVFNGGGNWGDMEMVSLTKELGRYFGTESGLLVVRAPDDDDLKLKDGDVIQRIDGREPQSVAHALRILASYQPGETLEIEIMRDRKREVLSIAIPDERQGLLWRFDEERPPAPVAAPRVEVHRVPGRRI